MDNKVRHQVVDAAHAEQRIDNYLRTQLKGLPKSRLYRLLRKGEIRVNKKRVKPDYRLQAGDDIRLPPLTLSPPKPTLDSPGLLQGLLQRIIFEDDSLLVINKPHGLAVHGGTHQSTALVECLKQGLKNEKIELIHRLDKHTSGCLLLAKNRQSLKHYHHLLRQRMIKKQYLAIIHGHWPRHCQKIELPLLRLPSPSGERRVIVSEEGQTAITLVTAVRYFKGASLLTLTLVTGRTHQIRVHLASQQHPIIGDEKYGSPERDKQLLGKKANRMFLHANSITIPPGEEQPPLSLIAPTDKSWQMTLDKLEEN